METIEIRSKNLGETSTSYQRRVTVKPLSDARRRGWKEERVRWENVGEKSGERERGRETSVARVDNQIIHRISN